MAPNEASSPKPHRSIFDIATAVSTVVTTLATIALALIAYKGFSDPLSGAIAEHLLAGTVVDLQKQKVGLEKKRSELQNENSKQKAEIEADRIEQTRLNEETKEKQSTLEHLQDELKTNANKLADLANQLDTLKSQETTLRQKIHTLNSALATAKEQTGRQIRNSLIYAAARTASQIYDERLNAIIYKNMPPNTAILGTRPVMNDNGKCFERFRSNDSFTWWTLMECAGDDAGFPWPSEGETLEIKSDLKKLKDDCPFLTKAFSITPTPGQGKDASIATIVEFRAFTRYLDQPILREHFCLDTGRH